MNKPAAARERPPGRPNEQAAAERERPPGCPNEQAAADREWPPGRPNEQAAAERERPPGRPNKQALANKTQSADDLFVGDFFSAGRRFCRFVFKCPPAAAAPAAGFFHGFRPAFGPAFCLAFSLAFFLSACHVKYPHSPDPESLLASADDESGRGEDEEEELSARSLCRDSSLPQCGGSSSCKKICDDIFSAKKRQTATARRSLLWRNSKTL